MIRFLPHPIGHTPELPIDPPSEPLSDEELQEMRDAEGDRQYHLERERADECDHKT